MATYYVRTTGSDVTGDGSQANPWATISHAVSNSSYGDTIDIGEGTFNDDLPAGRVYRGAGMLKTTVNGIFTSGGLSYSSAFLHVYHLTVNLNADITSRITTYGYSADYGFIFEHVRVLGGGSYGTNGSEWMYGRFKIIRSIFDGIKIENASGGMFLLYGGTTVPNLYMINSIISRITYISSGNYWGNTLSTGKGNLIKNSILYDAGELYLHGVDLGEWKHRYNAYYGATIRGDSLDATEETFTSDPFVDITNGDFRLSENSTLSFGEPV